MESNFPAGATAGDGGATPEFNLADRMRKAMRDAGISAQDMAAYLGCSRTSISNWTNGRVEPDTRTLRLWALRTGVSYDWLTGAPARAAS